MDRYQPQLQPEHASSRPGITPGALPARRARRNPASSATYPPQLANTRACEPGAQQSTRPRGYPGTKLSEGVQRTVSTRCRRIIAKKPLPHMKLLAQPATCKGMITGSLWFRPSITSEAGGNCSKGSGHGRPALSAGAWVQHGACLNAGMEGRPQRRVQTDC